MADEQLGITIKFRGESVEFSNDLKGIDNSIKLLQKDAKNLNKELKLDPKNSKALEEYFVNLKQQAEQLTKKIEIYKKAISDMPEMKTADDVKKMESLISSLDDAEIRLAKVNKQMQLFNVQDVSQLGTNLQKVGSQLTNISGILGDIGRSFTALSTASAAALTIGLKYNASLEQNTIALTTALGSEAEALKVIEKIQKDAQSTPWSVSELIDYNRTLIATGLSAEESEKIILSLGNAISATGGSSDVFSRMVSNLQQIKNSGNATAMDIRQFANAGIDIYGILSTYLGKTTDQITEQDRTWENIIGAFQMASSEGGKYFGAMEAQSSSLTSSINKLKDEWEQALGEITESLLPLVKSIISTIKSWAEALKELTPEQQEALGKVLLFTTALAPLFTGLSKIIGTIGGLTSKIGTFLKSEKVLTWLSKVRTLIASNGGVLETLKSILTSTGGVIGIVTAALILIYAKCEAFRDAVNELAKEIVSALKPVLNSLITILKTLWSFIKTYIIPAFNGIIQVVGTLLSIALEPFIYLVKNSLGPVLKGLATIIETIIVVAFKYLGVIIDSVISYVKGIIEWVKNAYNTFKEVGAIQVFKNALSVCGNILSAIFTPALKVLKSVLVALSTPFTTIKDKVVALYNKFSESTAFQTFKDSINSLKSAIDKLGSWISGVKDKVSSAIDKLKEMFGYDGKTVNVTTKTTQVTEYVTKANPRSVTSLRTAKSGGFGNYASGGFAFTINVTNQGASLNANTIKQWAGMLTDQINENLGKEM